MQRDLTSLLPGRHQQRGATLVVALILLMVMTILGIASMGTTGLEEKMAANSQEVFRALQAADAGITQAYASINATNYSTPTEGGSLQLKTGSSTTPAGACYTFRYLGDFTPPTQAGGMDQTKQAWYFDVQSIGYNQVDTSGNCTGSANSFGNATTRTASSTVNGGLYQIAPETPYVQPNT
jgi:Tfp pilus assembly protein PilX